MFTATAISAPCTAVPTPTTISSATPTAVVALMSTTAGATSTAAAPTSAAMSAAALGKLRRYQYERRMSTICLVHSFVCLGRSYGFRGEELF